MKGGTGGTPLWASVLLAAEAWGTPPWEITERRGGLKWLARWAELRRLQSFVSQPGSIAQDEGDNGDG